MPGWFGTKWELPIGDNAPGSGFHLTLIESDATDGISALVDPVSTIEFGASKLELVAFMLLALHCP
jgi:hypothetical protein